MQLAAAGIRVAGGSPFLGSDGPGSFIRVTAGALQDDVAPIARAIALAARPDAPGPHSLETRWA